MENNAATENANTANYMYIEQQIKCGNCGFEGGDLKLIRKTETIYRTENSLSKVAHMHCPNCDSEDIIYPPETICGNYIYDSATVSITDYVTDAPKESKWIVFEKVVPEKPRKTEIFKVVAKADNFVLGEIKWYPSWRCYAFYPTGNTVFELTCLQDITNFVKSLMKERKKK